MVNIYVENSATGVCIGCDLDLSQPIRDLKVAIEATEGFAIADTYFALCDWDGDMKVLHRFSSGHLSEIDLDLSIPRPKSKRAGLRAGEIQAGFLVHIYGKFGFVSSSCRMANKLASHRRPSEPDSEVPPGLPAFDFPRAEPLQFIVAVGERGHSYVQISLTYENRAPPGQATLVNVKLDCPATGERSITSVSFMITVQGQSARDVKHPEARGLGPTEAVNVSVTTRHVSEQHLTAQAAAPQGLGGAEIGASRENEQTRTESGVRQSETEITGLIRGRTTAHWTVAGALGIDKRDAVPPVLEGMSFVMDEKPAVFDYACYVTTSSLPPFTIPHKRAKRAIREQERSKSADFLAKRKLCGEDGDGEGGDLWDMPSFQRQAFSSQMRGQRDPELVNSKLHRTETLISLAPGMKSQLQGQGQA
ncbi:hypothetical protein B0H14DRAFT_3483985 [Mycena olivaceomarginata]|nr:hypothetical protein B0H14DRAFT_3483985 [Mycena olivaceomarginata]